MRAAPEWRYTLYTRPDRDELAAFLVGAGQRYDWLVTTGPEPMTLHVGLRPPKGASAASVATKVCRSKLAGTRPASTDELELPVCLRCAEDLQEVLYDRRVLEQEIHHETGGPMRTQIFVHDDGNVSVVTDATDERDFEGAFGEAFVQMLGKLNGNGRETRRKALAAGFDIVAKLRGYKSEVMERRTLAAGRWPHPTEQPVAAADEDEE